ncbi:unnamed protein product [Phaedon cochleariae]|uniref:Major facilitator superfamily (MFS) profile domain-containing protein n=1 Tax=Phaedon cochleariae TaxID=80249 RepID=A0A9N9SIQ3_PHACE|nr:unnamed protein product [Phaedon cochleariae]
MKSNSMRSPRKYDLENSNQKEKHWYQIMTITVVSLVPLTNGLQLAWTSPFLVKITQDKENYDITENETSYFTSIQPAAMLLTSIILFNLSDLLGRKTTMLVIAVPQVLAWVLAALATDVYLFYAMKVCAGIAVGMGFASVPMYIGEISSPSVRGTWGCLFSSGAYLGQFLINLVGNLCSVKVTSYIFVTVPILFFFFLIFLPESPYFLVMKGKHDEARAALKVFTRKVDVEAELSILRTDVERQISETGTWMDLFRIESNRKALVAAVFLAVSQSFGGLTAFIVYVQFFFDKAGGYISAELSATFYMGLSFVLNLLVILFVIDRMERKKCYIVSMMPCSIVLMLMAIYLYIDEFETHIDVSFLNWVPLAGMIIFQIFASFGMAIIPTLMLGELFSASVKTKATTVVMICFGISVTLADYLFYVLYRVSGIYAPILLFGCCNAISTILSFFLIPETRGKSLEEIQQALKGAMIKN